MERSRKRSATSTWQILSISRFPGARPATTLRNETVPLIFLDHRNQIYRFKIFLVLSWQFNSFESRHLCQITALFIHVLVSGKVCSRTNTFYADSIMWTITKKSKPGPIASSNIASGILLGRFLQISYALFLSKGASEALAHRSSGSQYLRVRLNADPSFIPVEI